MLVHELRKPLKRRSLGERLWEKRPGVFSLSVFALLLTFAGFAIWAVRTPYPFAGEPVLVMNVPPVQEMTTGSTDKAEDATPSEQGKTEAAEEQAAIPDTGPDPDVSQEAEDDSGVRIIRPQDQQVVETDSAIIFEPRRTLTAAPIAAVSEQGPYGVLPKIGANNKKPASVYARSASQQVLSSDVPKIAIVLGGMGLNADLTKQASQDLPGEITFAFAPYGENLQAQVNKVRASGHEVMLQLPMEPFGYPAVNPGPKTILSNADANTNLDALAWHMGRFAGYVGIVNYMGGKILGEPQMLRPIFAELKKRGLIFLGDGTASRNMAGDVGRILGLPVRSASVIIDANPSADAIAAQLAQLEEAARQSGFAIGTGTGLDVTISSVSQWAKTLADRGVVLIPVSAAFKGRAS